LPGGSLPSLDRDPRSHRTGRPGGAAAQAAAAAFGFRGRHLRPQRHLARRPQGPGHRVWGARTMSSDPEWKYVNVIRLFLYLEHSIDRGTQWAVFEPNNRRLWDNVRRTIEDFLLTLWSDGALLGDKPEQAFFVRCDRTTMTQNDLDNGRLICLIGVSPVKPAEFVIFRIGQWTADSKV